MDLSKISPFNLGALAAGGFTLLISFIPFFYRVKVDGAEDLGISGVSDGINAWHELGVLAMLLFVLAVAAVAVKVFAPQVVPPAVPASLVALALGVLSLLFLFLYALTIGPDIPAFASDGVSAGLSFTGYLQFLTTIAFVVFTALGFKSSGEKIPDFTTGGGQPPAGPTPPAPPGSGPQPPAPPAGPTPPAPPAP